MRSAEHVAESIDTKVIGQRVDWLELAFQLSSFLRARGYLWRTVQILFVASAALVAYLVAVGAGIRSPKAYLRAAPALLLFGYAMVETRTSPSERFHWLTAPRSDVLQPSPVHEGVTDDLERELEELFRELVGEER